MAGAATDACSWLAGGVGAKHGNDFLVSSRFGKRRLIGQFTPSLP